jgi:hypothetical protein
MGIRDLGETLMLTAAENVIIIISRSKRNVIGRIQRSGVGQDSDQKKPARRVSSTDRAIVRRLPAMFFGPGRELWYARSNPSGDSRIIARQRPGRAHSGSLVLHSFAPPSARLPSFTPFPLLHPHCYASITKLSREFLLRRRLGAPRYWPAGLIAQHHESTIQDRPRTRRLQPLPE